MKQLFITLLVIISTSLFSQEYDVKNISVNTEYSDFGVNLYGKDSVIYASTRKDMSPYKSIWKGNRQPYLSLYKGGLKSNGEIEGIRLFSKEITSKYHESNTYFTKDLKTVYFSRNNYLNKVLKLSGKRVNLIQLYKASIKNNKEWSDIKPMPFNNDEYQTGHPSLNEAEDKLYFTSDMPGTKGLTDIYMVNIYSDGSYGEPKNLGTKINTEKKEMFPHIGAGNILYFSSEGHLNNKGGLDIYKVALGDDGMPIEAPINMGTPLNSEKDDFGLVFLNREEAKGYFSSNREGGKGDDDIYYFKQKPCLQDITGIVRDKKTLEILINAKVRLLNSEGKVLGEIFSNDKGAFLFKKIPCLAVYTLEGSKEMYEPSIEEVKTTSEHLKVQKKDLYLNPIIKKCVVEINPIYFDFDKYNVRKDASIELDKVVSVMRKYPELKIEGGSHTDSRGSDKYNETLSQNRANSTVAYIISKGIDSNRITAKGYGEYQLVNKCSNRVKCTEKEHQYNRRTEFVITNLNEVKKIYPNLCKLGVINTKQQIERKINIKVGPKK